jgi:exosome complex RNA-binding protein Csl4
MAADCGQRRVFGIGQEIQVGQLLRARIVGKNHPQFATRKISLGVVFKGHARLCGMEKNAILRP